MGRLCPEQTSLDRIVDYNNMYINCTLWRVLFYFIALTAFDRVGTTTAKTFRKTTVLCVINNFCKTVLLFKTHGNIPKRIYKTIPKPTISQVYWFLQSFKCLYIFISIYRKYMLGWPTDFLGSRAIKTFTKTKKII